MEGMNPAEFRQAVRRGAGRAAETILQILTGEREIESPVEGAPATFLTLCFRHDLDADEHQIFRTALLEILNAYCRGDERVQSSLVDELLYVVQSSSLPRRRRTEVTALIFACIQTAEARGDRPATIAFLNLLADEVLVTNFEEWVYLYARIGPDAAMPCFFGMAQLDPQSAFVWLWSEVNAIDYELIRDFAFPSVLKMMRPHEAAQLLLDLRPKTGSRLVADLSESCQGVYGLREELFSQTRKKDFRKAQSRDLMSGDSRRRAWAEDETQEDRDLSPRDRLAKVGVLADALPGDDGFYPPGLALKAV